MVSIGNRIRKDTIMKRENFFTDRFYSNRAPAWHHLSSFSGEPMGAQQAFSSSKPYSISLHELTRKGSDKGIGHYGIFREPIPEDKSMPCFGIVSAKYVLIQPNDICRIFDEEIGKNIEALGSWKKGKTFFITTQLPKCDINGDPVENYIIVSASFSGSTAIRIRATPVRIRCINMLPASRRLATAEYSIRNVSGSEKRLRETIRKMYKEAKQKVDALKELFTIWSETKVTKKESENLLNEIYPNPEPPEPSDATGTTMSQDRSYAYGLERRERDRSLVAELFEGVMSGYEDTPAVRGTVWGLWNAVTEYENYRPGRTLQGRAKEVMFGVRANQMEDAFSVLNTFADKK